MGRCPTTTVDLPSTSCAAVWCSPDADGVTALAYEGDRIVWIGTEAQADALARDADEIVELEGALVTPGWFVDAHVHLAQTGLNAHGVDLAPARSRGTRSAGSTRRVP